MRYSIYLNPTKLSDSIAVSAKSVISQIENGGKISNAQNILLIDSVSLLLAQLFAFNR